MRDLISSELVTCILVSMLSSMLSRLARLLAARSKLSPICGTFMEDVVYSRASLTASAANYSKWFIALAFVEDSFIFLIRVPLESPSSNVAL